MKFSLTNEFKDRLRDEILNYNIDFIQKSFEGVSYVDITELLYEFDSNDSKYILDNIDFDISSSIFCNFIIKATLLPFIENLISNIKS